MYSTSDLDICRTSDGLHCVMWALTWLKNQKDKNGTLYRHELPSKDIQNHYYRPTTKKDILEYCQACETCTAYTSSTYRALLHRHKLAKAPFQVIGMEFLGPITPVSPNENNYFSRWVEEVALKDETAQTAAECSPRPTTPLLMV
ncbi:hypothetical protein OUZ56_016451 [Daphnia magna]|uniref:Uncharacterized protein n=1 Tax=Daphnia magna TaxID=35525 RepID=A0ABR0AQK4_9CRUS|nr:hypothetical protein OUZ56_016451 [Daphnia magna]